MLSGDNGSGCLASHLPRWRTGRQRAAQEDLLGELHAVEVRSLSR